MLGVSQSIGSLKDGMMADFAVLLGNPIEDLSQIRHVVQTWIGEKNSTYSPPE